MANKTIPELLSTIITQRDLIEVAHTEDGGENYDSSNSAEIGDVVNFATRNLSDSYDSTETYYADDVVIYENRLYKCTAETTGDFDSTKWTATTIDELIASARGTISVGVLKAGQTSVTILGEIFADNTFQIFTNAYGLAPTAVSVASGSITLTFEPQETDVRVKVVARADNDPIIWDYVAYDKSVAVDTGIKLFENVNSSWEFEAVISNFTTNWWGTYPILISSVRNAPWFRMSRYNGYLNFNDDSNVFATDDADDLNPHTYRVRYESKVITVYRDGVKIWNYDFTNYTVSSSYTLRFGDRTATFDSFKFRWL